jgi:hypothetical protein
LTHWINRFGANKPGKLRTVRAKPLRDSVRRRAHDAPDFAIQTIDHRLLLVGVKQFSISSKDVDSIHDTTEGPKRFHLLLERPRAPHLQFENQKAFGQIICSALQLPEHAGIIAVDTRQTTLIILARPRFAYIFFRTILVENAIRFFGIMLDGPLP